MGPADGATDAAAPTHSGDASALDLPALAPALVNLHGATVVHAAWRPVDPRGCQ